MLSKAIFDGTNITPEQEALLRGDAGGESFRRFHHRVTLDPTTPERSVQASSFLASPHRQVRDALCDWEVEQDWIGLWDGTGTYCQRFWSRTY